jgi:hypothetical protein
MDDTDKNMKIATSWSTAPDTKAAFEECFAALTNKLDGYPSYLLIYFTERYPAASLLAALEGLPAEVKVHGCTSCQGVMTEEGVHSDDGRALALLGIRDAQGAYGVGCCPQGTTPREAARTALIRALVDAGRPGEQPDYVWLNASPGHEEQVILGLQDVVSTEVPIVGGSAADNDVAGRWQLLTRNGVETDAVVVSVLFPSCRSTYSFQSGYSPNAHRGIVTSASGRVIHTIDQQPAAAVYNTWTRGLLDAVLPMGGNVLMRTTLTPLGRVAGTVGDVSFFTLSHPDSVGADGSLSLFTQVEAGQEMFLMTGSKDGLVTRAARVTQAAIELEDFAPDQLHGAIIVYCAGCMLTVQERMPEVVEKLNRTLDGKPFIGIFTFGEQGCLLDGSASHGNLMISSLVFAR